MGHLMISQDIKQRRMTQLALFFVMNALDALTTSVALSIGGTEVNPVMNLFGLLGDGPTPIILTKIVLTLLAGYVLSTKIPRVIPPVSLVIGGVVLWNCTAIMLMLIGN